MPNTSTECFNCGSESKCRRRDFSEQAWTVLLLWDEVQPAAVDQPICEDCYNELRETLIDRAEEMELALVDAQTIAKTSRVGSEPTPPAKSKVRKAG